MPRHADVACYLLSHRPVNMLGRSNTGTKRAAGDRAWLLRT
jgi:hypothetical protein